LGTTLELALSLAPKDWTQDASATRAAWTAIMMSIETGLKQVLVPGRIMVSKTVIIMNWEHIGSKKKDTERGCLGKYCKNMR
jgi:hypothetical protein